MKRIELDQEKDLQVGNIEIEGFITMEDSPAEAKAFAQSFATWLASSKWNFEGTIRMIDSSIKLRDYQNKNAFRKVKNAFFSIVFMLIGVYGVAVFGATGDNFIGITAVITMWFAGVLFEKGFNS